MKNIGIAGFGAIGPIHAAAIEGLENAKIAAICDTDKKRADSAAKKYGAKAFYDFKDMLKSGDVNSVHICTPHYLHKDMAISAIGAGLDIVLEKPVAMNECELDELIDAAQNSSSRLCVMLQNRTNYCIRTLLKLISDKEISGEVLSVNGYMTWNRDAAYYRSGKWRGKWSTEGGGLLINQAIHLIDLMGVIGGEISAVRGSISNKWLGDIIEVEDTADAIFEFKNGSHGCFYATNSSVCSTPVQIDVFCEKVHYRYADAALYELKNGKLSGIVCTDDDAASGKQVWGSGHKYVINSFYNSGEYTTLAQAENSARALYAFYKSAKANGKRTLVNI